MTPNARLRITRAVVIAVALSAPVAARAAGVMQPGAGPCAERLKGMTFTLQEAWRCVYDDVRARRQLVETTEAGIVATLKRPGPGGAPVDLSDGDKLAIYKEMVTELLAIPGLVDRYASIEQYKALVNETARRVPEGKLAKSASSASTNPISNLLERSGFTDLAAIAADARQLFASDGSAITVNLNALAIVKAGDPAVYTQPAVYRQMGAARRLGGSFTFGAKLPKSELTGFSGFPDADRLFDAIAWDVKVRILGDRDPRDARWWPLMSRAGAVGELLANAITLDPLPVQDAAALSAAMTAVYGEVLDRVKATISRSAQITIKGAGQHLTKESGINKYAGALLADVPLGESADATVNVGYSYVETTFGVPAHLNDLSIVFGITGTIAQNAFADGRGVELALSGDGHFALNDVWFAPDRKSVWKATASAAVPFAKGAKIPFALIWTNDPNNLVKQQYVTGQIGVSYDFGALKSLFAAP